MKRSEYIILALCLIALVGGITAAYYWKVNYMDRGGLSNVSDLYEFTGDTTPPSLTIQSPHAITSNETNLLDLNVSCLDATSSCNSSSWRFSVNDGENFTFAPNTTITSKIGEGISSSININMSGGGVKLSLNDSRQTETLRPNAAGDECTIQNQSGCSACPYHYGCVNQTSSQDGFYIYSENVEDNRDLYNLPQHTGSGTINKVCLWIRFKGDTLGDSSAYFIIKTHGCIYTGAGLKYDTYGTLTSKAITPAQIVSWGKFYVNDNVSAQGTNITYKILDATDNSTKSNITESEAGSGYDISTCASGLTSIRLFANLTTTNSSNTPILYDWNVSWTTPEDNPPTVTLNTPANNDYLNSTTTATAVKDDGTNYTFNQWTDSTYVKVTLNCSAPDCDTTQYCTDTTIYMYYGNPTADSASNGTNTFSFFDDFDRADSGTVGNGWTETYDASFDVSTNQLKGTWVSGHNAQACHKSFTADTYIYQTRMKVSQTDGRGFFIFYGEVDDRQFGAFFDLNGNFKALDSTYAIIGTYLADTWYDIIVTYHKTAGTFDVSVEGIGSESGLTPREDTNHNIIAYYTGYETGIFYAGSVFVRKYAPPEPGVSVGSEQDSMPLVQTPSTYDNSTLTANTIFARSDAGFINVSITGVNGQSDLSTALITILNTIGGFIVSNDTMTQDGSITNGYVYNYSWQVPSDADGETWTINIYANDSANSWGSNTTTFEVVGLQINVTTNQPDYNRNDTVNASGVFQWSNGTALGGKNVTVKFINTTGDIVDEANVTTASDADLGDWKVNVTGWYNTTDSVNSTTTFNVNLIKGQYYLWPDNPTHGQELGNNEGRDTGSLLLPQSNNSEEIYCIGWVQFYFDENDTYSQAFNFRSIYYHIWWRTVIENATIGYQLDGAWTGSLDKNYTTNSGDSHASVGGYYLSTYLLNASGSLTGNEIYNFTIKLTNAINTNPYVISGPNQLSFIIINPTDNGTLNTTDSDADELTDYEEMYEYYTDPRDGDTDNDGWSDYSEVITYDTDPNDYEDYPPQKSFILNPDDPIFSYEHNKLNDSSTTKNIDFAGNENKTVWISIPKNSSVTGAKLNISGTVFLNTSIAHTGNVYSVYADSEYIYSGGADHKVHIYNRSTFEGVINLTDATGTIVSVYADSEYIYSGSADHKVHIYNRSTFEGVTNLTDATGTIVSVYADSEYIYSGSADHKVHIYNRSTFEGVINLTDATGTIVSVYADSEYIYSGSADNTTRVYNKSTFSNVANLSDATGTIVSVYADSEYIYSGSYDHKVHIYNRSTFEGVTNMTEATCSVLSVYANSEYIFSGAGLTVDCWDNRIHIYNKSNFEGILDITDSVGDIYTLYSDSNYIYASTGGEDDKVRIYTNFPRNPWLDVAANGTKEWEYSGNYSSTQTTNNFSSEINTFLSTCTPTNKRCSLPLKHHSDDNGRLKDSKINITYDYNASAEIYYNWVWNETNNIIINKTYNRGKNITYDTNPAENITIWYIKINPSATTATFNGTSCTIVTINSDKACNLTATGQEFIIWTSGALPGSTILWDDTQTGLAATKTIKDPENITGNIWNMTYNISVNEYPGQQLTNITFNLTLNDTAITVVGSEYVNVTWDGTEYDLEDYAENQGDCDTSTPTYNNLTTTDGTFWLCKKDTNSDGIFDYVGIKQPHGSDTTYIVGGGTLCRVA